MDEALNDSKIYTIEDLREYGSHLHFITLLDIILNGIACYIILKHSTKPMGIYKYYILSTIIFSFLQDFNITFIFGPYPILPTAILCSTGIVTRNLDWIIGRVVPYVILHFNLSFAGLSIIYGLLYQYFSLTGDAGFFYSSKGVIILFIIMLLYPLPSVISLLSTLDREGALKYVKEKIPNVYNIFISAPCNTFVINFWSKLYFGIVAFQIIFICMVSWTIFYIIQKKLHELRKSLSRQTLRARRQLVLALVLQQFVPAILLVAPIFIMIGAIFLRATNMKDFSFYAMQLLALHSCANASTVLLVITPYRRVLIRWFNVISFYPRKIFCKSKPVSSIIQRNSFSLTVTSVSSTVRTF